MAGKPRFRVPTLEEMEKADQQEAMVSSRTLIRRDGSSKSADTAPDTKSTDSPKAKNIPSKRVMSQKALLSRMPLSRQMPTGKSTVSSNKAGTSSSEKTQSAAVSKGFNPAGDRLAHHHASHSAKDDGNQSKLKGLPDTVTAGSSSASASKDLTSKWTGNTLGGNRRNAQLPQDHLLPGGSAAGPQSRSDSATTLPSVRSAMPSTSTTAPSEQPGSSSINASNTTEQQDSVRADVLPTLAKLGKTNSLIVSSRQRGNPILKFVRNVPWEYGNIVPDYVMGQSNCALYLSLRYHQLHPEYIHNRLKQLGHSFDLRVLLVQVDIKDPHHLLKDLAKICILADCTLMVAFSAEEAGKYLETYKVYENKAAEALMERTDSNFSVQLSDCLTRVKSVNKTDCSTLLATFGDLQGIMEASTEDLSLCPGFGPQKAKRLHDVFREPFLVSKKQQPDAASTKD
ncbi:uncharacterized protein LOC143291288 [Babylonia areolata]|uniref:uncharacterized protein LOC143291288 n=1 Tax=Babylonia areolata TaxID=304850 RepID=UPI003FCF67E6